jgi:hypothetical protein
MRPFSFDAAPLRCLVVTCALAACLPIVALGQAHTDTQPGDLGPCGSLRNGYGPFDYRTDRQQLVIVETYHFNSGVEQLVRGSTGSIGGDLDYTLRAYPNHHRALNAMYRYGEKLKSEFVPGATYSVECYFIRAINHRQDDSTVRLLYAIYLKGQRRQSDAIKQLTYTEAIAGENGFAHFNIGLVYLELGDYEAALRQAHRAIALGFTRPDLKDRLVAANRWADPAPTTIATPADPASAAR